MFNLDGAVHHLHIHTLSALDIKLLVVGDGKTTLNDSVLWRGMWHPLFTVGYAA